MKHRCAAALLAAAIGAFGASASLAEASSYPNSPVKLVVGFPPGGPTDVIARVVAQSLSRELKQSVIVENKGGAGGVVAAGLVARQKPDGYTLMLTVEGAQTRGVVMNPDVVSYDPVKDFTALGKVAKQSILMVVHPGVAANSATELVKQMKSLPAGQLNFAGTFGSSSHIGGALFDALNGTEMTFINYPGGGQPITDLLSGVVQVGFFSESTVGQHIKVGKLKALAVAAESRSRMFPNLPTMGEAGVRPMDVSPWFGVVGPAGMPQPVVARLSDAIRAMVNDKEFEEKLDSIGAVPVLGSTPQAFADDIEKDLAHWKKFFADNKLSARK